ncbi:putative DNA polymerase subunit Cdc27 [Elsinoe australis]|uniref:DNA polymerase delta subunit 3 n=1 Tax=Elsinoe australis TaxID=40998 RepID=A0A4U7AR08_9PEZI|nr:putative DNA polymerase subunit Cdc27 [Elsinoe australis]
MQDHNEYLAIHVLNESQIISYRQLSRALKIHSTLAKQCLYDFHARQNAKSSSTVHATYLLTGLRNPPPTSSQPAPTDDADGDVPMSSPYQSSQPSFSQQENHGAEQAAPPTRVVLIAREEDLQKAKASLDEVTGVHVYSLSPGPVRDLQTLSECDRKMAAEYYSEDPLEKWAQYGVIQNERVWRRTRKGLQVPPPEISGAKVEKEKEGSNAKEEEGGSQGETKRDAKVEEKAKGKDEDKKEDKKIPALKKESSSLFKSFAKTKAPKTKEKAKEKEQEDTTPALSDDEADEGDEMDLDEGAEKESVVEPGKSRKEREEELRKMMEEDDDMVDAAGTGAAEAEEQAKDEGAIDKPVEDLTEDKGEVTVENGRRRGRRRVMKKKTVKDEEGYLVTKEEPAWESFSEDEPPPPKKAKLSIMAQAAAKSTGAAKGAGPKKGGKGQNNIMSFFAKK